MEGLGKRLILAGVLMLSLGVVHTASGVNVLPTIVSPPNDDCSTAQPIGDVTNLAYDTTGARFDGRAYCMVSPNIWYCYTAPCTGNVTVRLSGTNYDTMLAVYNGCQCFPDDLIECNDDFGSGYESRITFAATAGSRYLIEVGGYGLEKGRGQLTVRCEGQTPPPPPPSTPPNNNCASAQPVGDVTNLAFDTRNATFDGPGHCMNGPNLWYRYTATCTGQAVVSLCGSGFDTVLAVYKGWECYPRASDMIGCNDDACGRQSELTFDVVAGNHYLIEVGGFGDLKGQGVLSIACEEQAPANRFDLGDAPDSSNNFGKVMMAYPSQGLLPVVVNGYYPTVFNDGSGAGPYGPVHVRPLAVAHLGEMVTWEAEADKGADQDGVNNIRPSANLPNLDKQDDGVVFPANLPHCRWATFDYYVNVVRPGTDLWVNVWCDWNRDGDWDDTLECTNAPAPEWAVQNQFLFNLPAGFHKITTPAILSWHPKVGVKEMWMRITLSEQPWKGGSSPGKRGNGGSGPRSKYDIGETEDYYFAPEGSHSVCEDFNGDGIINTQDLVDFTAAWLESCPE